MVPRCIHAPWVAVWWIQRATSSHPGRSMFVQLPPEIIDQIIECLPSKQDTCSIALACSALRPHAYRRLFRRLAVFVDGGNIVPTSAELILFYPHLLQYPTRLFIWHALLSKRRSVYSQKHGDIPTIPVHYIWSHLIDMPHLTSLNLCLSTSYYGAVLSTLERLDAGRNITLDLSEKLQHDVSMSENSLPVKCLTLPMDEPSHQLGKQLLQKCSQSLFELRLHLEGLCTPDFPFLPHLRVFSLRVTDGDLTPWLPFFMKHSSLTSVTLDNNITSINPVPPDLLPELQYLEAHPLVVERLIPGRPVHTVAIFTTTCLPDKLPSSYNTIFQSFTLPCAPVTTLDITVDAFQSAKLLVDTIRSLPMLRSLCFSVGYKVCCSLKCRSPHNGFNSFHLPSTVFYKLLENAGICNSSSLDSPTIVRTGLARVNSSGRETILFP